MPLNCTLKMAKMADLMWYVSCHNFFKLPKKSWVQKKNCQSRRAEKLTLWYLDWTPKVKWQSNRWKCRGDVHFRKKEKRMRRKEMNILEAPQKSVQLVWAARTKGRWERRMEKCTKAKKWKTFQKFTLSLSARFPLKPPGHPCIPSMCAHMGWRSHASVWPKREYESAAPPTMPRKSPC